MKDFLEMITTFFGEYFAYSLNAITVNEIWFEPTEINREKDKKALTLNPKQIIFTVFNILIGSCVVSTVTHIDFDEIVPFLVTAIIMWFLWSFSGFLICKVLNLRNLTLLNSFALTMQTFGVVYVLASILTFMTSVFYDETIDPIDLFKIFQFPLLLIYLSIAYLKNYTFKFKIQPILAAIVSSLIYAVINSQINLEKDLPVMSEQPSSNVLIIDASSIPKNHSAQSILSPEDYRRKDVIFIVSDTITEINVRKSESSIDSALNRIKYSKVVVFDSLYSKLNDYTPIRQLHIVSNFKWLLPNEKFESMIDTVFVYFITDQTTDFKDLAKEKILLDSTFKDFSHSVPVVFVSRPLSKN